MYSLHMKAEERYFAEVSGTWLINGKPLAMWFIGEGLTLSVGANSTNYGFQFFLGTLAFWVHWKEYRC